MRNFVNEKESTIPRLTYQAIYEIFVASLIGMNNVQNQEEDIRNYFSRIDSISSQQEFTDFTNLIIFVSVSAESHNTTFTKEEIDEWKQEIISVTDFEIENTTDINLNCKLHEVKFQQFFTGMRGEINDPEDYFKLQDLAFEEINTLVKLIPEAPFYPLVPLSKNINHYIDLMAEYRIVSEELEELASQIDDLKGQRLGKINAAESLRDRALTYLKNGNEIMAIKVLHKAKAKWSNEESRLALVLTLLMLSESYEKLNMTFAAKYFGLAAAHFSIRDENTELISYFIQSMTQLANIEYSHGAWLGYLQFLDTIFPVAQSVKKDFDLSEQEDINILAIHASIIKYTAYRFIPELKLLVDSKLKEWKWIGDAIDEYSEVVTEKYQNDSEGFFWNKVQEDLKFKPFNDVGEVRKVSFSAFGINWNFKFKNDYLTNSVAEQVIAILQILFVELASYDLHLLKTNVEVEIMLTDGKPDFERKPSNKICLWELHVPSFDEYEPEEVLRILTPCYHAFAFSVLFEITLLKTEEFNKSTFYPTI